MRTLVGENRTFSECHGRTWRHFEKTTACGGGCIPHGVSGAKAMEFVLERLENTVIYLRRLSQQAARSTLA